jgi:hypothetical protein
MAFPGDGELVFQQLSRRERRIITVGEALRDEDTSGQVQPIGDAIEECLVARFRYQ